MTNNHGDTTGTILGSFGFAIGPFAQALDGFAKALGHYSLSAFQLAARANEEVWARQSAVIEWIHMYARQIPELRNLASLASHSLPELDAWPLRRYFASNFPPIMDDEISVLSAFTATMKWEVAGVPTRIIRTEKDGTEVKYSAFRLPVTTFSIERLPHGGPFTERITIRASDGSTVCLARLPEEMEGPSDDASLLRLATQMVTATGKQVYAPGGIVLPALSFDVATRLAWLEGLTMTADTTWTASQVRQRVQFSMNEWGVPGECVFDKVSPYTIDRHFVLAAMQKTTQGAVPTAVFYLTSDRWYKPLALVR